MLNQFIKTACITNYMAKTSHGPAGSTGKSKTKIASVFGTRPEIIKMSQLIPLLDAGFWHRVLFTSQHYSENMAQIFFSGLGVRKPDAFLGVESSEYGVLQRAITQELERNPPDYLLCYGDTNSTLAAALAAKESGIRIIHVESGLRSYDQNMPEERNRVETDRLSHFLFAPTELSRLQLEREGLTKNVFVVGNTIVDACLAYAKKAKARKCNVLVTAHRQENVDGAENLGKIFECLAGLGDVLFPVHPRTRKNIEKFGLRVPRNVQLEKPMGYLEFLGAMKGANLIITDSGGVQEECITLRVPCLTIRDTTERWETIEEGGNFLVGLNPQLVKSHAFQILNGTLGRSMRKARNPYGRNVSARIAKILAEKLNED